MIVLSCFTPVVIIDIIFPTHDLSIDFGFGIHRERYFVSFYCFYPFASNGATRKNFTNLKSQWNIKYLLNYHIKIENNLYTLTILDINFHPKRFYQPYKLVRKGCSKIFFFSLVFIGFCLNTGYKFVQCTNLKVFIFSPSLAVCVTNL